MKHNKIFANLLILGWLYFLSQGAMATHHLWDIQEIYSNDDGSIQFIELFSLSANQDSLNGINLVSTDSTGTISTTYTFTSNSGIPTTNRSLLLATPGFAALPGGIVPDYEIPFDFLFTAGGRLDFDSGADVLNYAALPTDGINSLDSSGSINANSPTNFGGVTGNLIQNSYVILDATGILRIPVVDVHDTSGGVTLVSAILQLVSGTTDTFQLVSNIPTPGRAASGPGFHDNPSYDATTNVVEFPFVAFGTSIVSTERWYAELEYILSTTPMQFRLIPPTVISTRATVHHFHSTIEIFLELNMENTLAWATVPLQVNRGGRNHTLDSIYRDAGIDLTFAQNAPVADIRTGTRLGQPYTEAELLQFQQTYMTNPPPPAATGRWHIHGAFLPIFRSRSAITLGPGFNSTTFGIMFTNNLPSTVIPPVPTVPANEVRTGFAVFVDTIATATVGTAGVAGYTSSFGGIVTTAEGYLRTTAHELGHALNLMHSDGDARNIGTLGGVVTPAVGGVTIMNQTWRTLFGWNYLWDDWSFAHLNNHPLDRIRPSIPGTPTAFDWAACHNTTGNVIP
jgi:hypothetical protein